MATQLNRYGLALTAFFGLLGLTLLLGPFVGISFGSRVAEAFWLGVSCLVLWRWRRGNIEEGRRERIVEAGARGVATVISALSQGTGRGLPKLSLRLQLDVPGAEPRQIDLEEEVAVYASYGIKPGLRLPVVVDPRDPKNVVLVW